MADLRTDYKDDVLNINTNERRKYRMINNADGTISFEDVTDYVQNGDSFGSNDVNTITERVNRSLTGADVVDNLESTATNLPLSANMGRELDEKIAPILSNGLSGTSSSIVVEKGGSYTVPKDGYYCLIAKSGAQGIGANWFINGVIILTNANTEGVGVTFYLKKGTVLTTREEGNGTYAIVAIPL